MGAGGTLLGAAAADLSGAQDQAGLLGFGLGNGDLGLFDTGSGELESLQIDYWERKLIGEALKRTSGNVPEAAKLLGIGRATLYRKIDQYGISR